MKNYNFEEFCFFMKKNILTKVNIYNRFGLNHFNNQTDWILDSNNKKIVNFIGRYENLQQDFNTICDRILIPKKNLNILNKTNHLYYKDYYTEKTKKIVESMYLKDINYFKYKF